MSHLVFKVNADTLAFTRVLRFVFDVIAAERVLSLSVHSSRVQTQVLLVELVSVMYLLKYGRADSSSD